MSLAAVDRGVYERQAANLMKTSAQTTPAYLSFRDISKVFQLGGRRQGQSIAVLEDVSIDVAPREVVAVVGPSGCGKSTLLTLGAGLDRPTAGRIAIGGVPVDGPHAEVAFMLQKDLLLPWRTISANVEFGLEIKGMAREERRQRSHTLLEQFGLNGFSEAYPHQLSGGMRQRAALARTMALEPRILLLDEPFSALDAQTKIRLHGELATTIRQTAMTAVIITHDLTEAVVLADRIYVMSPRPGRIIKEIKVNLAPDDAVERYFDPTTADYVKEMWSLLSGA